MCSTQRGNYSHQNSLLARKLQRQSNHSRSSDTDAANEIFTNNAKQRRVWFWSVNKRRLLDIKVIIATHDAENCKDYLALLAVTICDMVSEFVRQEKVSPIKQLDCQQYFIKHSRRFLLLVLWSLIIQWYQQTSLHTFQQLFNPRSGHFFVHVDISRLHRYKSSLM